MTGHGSALTKRRSQKSPIRIFLSLICLLPLFIISASFAITTAAAQSSGEHPLTSVVIRGSSIYSAPQLFDVYNAHLGKPITRENVSLIVTSLADRYQADGYPRPRIGVDGALAAAGVLRLDVFETRIDAVLINGDPGPHRKTLERLAGALEASGALTQHDLQNALRRMRRLPGLTLRAATESREDVPNAYRLDLDTEFRSVSASARLTNRGTDEIGPHFVMGQVVANGLLGGSISGGLLYAAAVDSDEYLGAGPLLNWDLGERGTRLSFSGFTSKAKPRWPDLERDDRFVRERAGVRATIPVYDGDRMTTSLITGIDASDLRISRSGFLFRDERLRMLTAGVSQSWYLGSVQYAGSLEVVKGLDGLNSGLMALDLAADPRTADFTLLRLDVARLARYGLWSLRFDGFAQESRDVLPFTERFKIGGERLGRGFERAQIAGDRGIGAKLELARELPDAPALLGKASAYGFYDIGAVWKNDVAGRDSAATAGIGFAIRDEHTVAKLELARPLVAPNVEGRDDLRLFFELLWRR